MGHSSEQMTLEIDACSDWQHFYSTAEKKYEFISRFIALLERFGHHQCFHRPKHLKMSNLSDTKLHMDTPPSMFP